MTLSGAGMLRVVVVAAVPALLLACVEQDRGPSYPAGYYGGYYDNTSTERRTEAGQDRGDGDRIDERREGYRVCDDDGERCYLSPTRDWSAREYERRQRGRPQ